jgi:hypothetical protein
LSLLSSVMLYVSLIFPITIVIVVSYLSYYVRSIFKNYVNFPHFLPDIVFPVPLMLSEVTETACL